MIDGEICGTDSHAKCGLNKIKTNLEVIESVVIDEHNNLNTLQK